METSLIMYLHSHLVGPLAETGEGAEKKSKVKALREGWAWAERKWSMVTADTGIGNPKASSEEKGARFFRDVTEKVAQLMIDLEKLDITDRYE